MCVFLFFFQLSNVSKQFPFIDSDDSCTIFALLALDSIGTGISYKH